MSLYEICMEIAEIEIVKKKGEEKNEIAERFRKCIKALR